MRMFARDEVTYEYDPSVIGYILSDEANPLRRICEIIHSHSKVLDVGAGNGLLAVVMKMFNKEVIVDGIEPDLHAAKIARSHYRFFGTGSVQDYKEHIQKEDYDYIIMADVLEHFTDPQSFLDALVSWIPLKTKIVLSIPNIAFGAIRLDLLKGNFRYVDSGIIEKTHLRFFTLETLQKLVSTIGLNIEKICFLQRDFLTTDIRQSVTGVGWSTLYNLMRDESASTYQFLVVLSQTSVITEQKYYGVKTKVRISEIVRSVFEKWLK